MEMESELEIAATAAGRKRKADEGESESLTTSSQVKTRRASAAAEEQDCGSSVRSESCSCETDGVLVSCCSSNGATDVVEDFVDLEENAVADNLTAADAIDSGERGTTLPSIDDTASESDSAAETRKSRCPLDKRMPTEEEIAGFFAAAEKQFHKQFIDKYNYDIQKDSPIQGRFEWVPLQP